MTKKRRRSSSRVVRPVARPRPPIDRFAAWLGSRSRAVRSLICGGVALSFTVALALLMYGSLFNVAPDRLNFGPVSGTNLPLVMLVVLTIIGLVFYWVGWRVLIGFDSEETPLEPGRPAALWVMLGGFVFILVIVGAAVSALLASQS